MGWEDGGPISYLLGPSRVLGRKAVSVRTFQHTFIIKSTLSRRQRAVNLSHQIISKPVPRPHGLSTGQEKKIASVFRDFSSGALPIIKDEIADVIQMMYGAMPPIALRFNNECHGKDWLTSFCKRHGLKLNSNSKLKAEHCRCTNAATLAKQIASSAL